jgi:uncharacterized protein with ParB-like and HNH nuclease domain
MFDYRLVNALDKPDPERDLVYDFDVYLPTYGINLQRPYVWELFQQREFIMSILLEKPIDSLVIVKDLKDYANRNDEVNLVIDGKQRLMTIQKFVHNEFPIVVNGRDIYYKDFDYESERFFKSRANSLTATVYYSYPDSKVTDEMLIILFNYYNFAGTPQTESHKEKLQSLISV